jgi:hypothetical protein
MEFYSLLRDRFTFYMEKMLAPHRKHTSGPAQPVRWAALLFNFTVINFQLCQFFYFYFKLQRKNIYMLI